MIINSPNSAFQFLSQIKSVMPEVARKHSVEELNELLFNNSAFTHLMAASPLAVARREIDILNYTKKGLRNHEIAEALHISIHTVATHKKNILKKTGKESIIQLLSE